MDPSRIVAVIMAGGGGTRFWPRSRRAVPKQFLSFDGKTSLIAQTAERLRGFVPAEQTLVITGAEHRALALAHTGLPERSIIGEPAPRDTAACIGLGALLTRSFGEDRVMVALSADHLVEPVEPFREAMLRAADLASSTGSVVTVGLRPERPATGYGYIEMGERLDDAQPSAWRVEAFREKPDLETARRFLLAGNFLWNSGMFAFRPDAILGALKTHVPELHGVIATISDPWDPAELARVYPKLPKISIDYGVMEKTRDRLVVEAGFEWDDLGTFEAVARHSTRAGEGNLSRGEAAFIGSHGSLVDNDTPGLVVVSGLNDVLVVRTDDAVLVLPRADAEKVKDVVRELKDKGFGRYL